MPLMKEHVNNLGSTNGLLMVQTLLGNMSQKRGFDL